MRIRVAAPGETLKRVSPDSLLRRAKRFRRPLTRRNNAEQSKHVTRPER